MAHELHHVVLRHALHGLIKQLGLVAIVTTLVGSRDGLIGLAERAGLKLADLKFNRDMQTRADTGGLHCCIALTSTRPV